IAGSFFEEDSENSGIRRERMLRDHEAIVAEEPAPSTEFTFSDDDPDDEATRAGAMRQRFIRAARQATLDPDDGIALQGPLMKERLSVYLDPHERRSLIVYADRRGKSKSLVAEAAIASFLSPDAAERQEATLARRLDRLAQPMERLERDVGITVETLALFVRF